MIVCPPLMETRLQDAKWVAPPFSADAVRRGVWIFLALGILARCVRYFLDFPLWEDESFLVSNYIDKGYGDLLGALEPHQAAPILYLWTQLTIVKLLGFTEMSLRLLAFVTSIASLLVFRRLAERLLSGTSLLLAVALFAMSYPCIRYCAEAKQYGTDMFVGTVMTFLVVRWLQHPERTRPLWILAAFAPIAIGFSYPAAFLGGGISLTVAYVLWRHRRPGWAAWAVYNVLLCATFLVVVLVAARQQTAAELEFMRAFWHAAFPPGAPLAAIVWFFKIHVGNMFGYPGGTGTGGGLFGISAFTIGLVVLTIRRRRALILLAVAPLALNLIAAAARRYPYGGHAKFAVYLAPIFCLVGGLGAAAAVATLSRTPRWARRGAAGLLLVFALVGMSSMVRDIARPYKTLADQRARDFARWFWNSAAYEGEVVDLKTDLGLKLSEAEDTELSWFLTYRVNQHMYRKGGPPRLDRVTKDHPVRFVRYRVQGFAYDEERFQRWLDETRRRYEIVGTESYPFVRYDKLRRYIVRVDHLDIYTCIPRTDDD